jgi:predicted nuclease of predicted toxin-antitoxin system
LEKIRLYIDEDLSDRVAVALRSKGFDAISAHEVNMRSKTDKEQLDI